jgi:hypothetical protein
MALLLAAALISIAAMVAYPWFGMVAGIALVVFVATAALHGRRTRRTLPAVPAWIPLDRRMALRAAWRDLNEIERGAGLLPTPLRR